MSNPIGAPKSLATATPRSASFRAFKNRLFVVICIAAAFTALVVLAILLTSIAWQGLTSLNWNFVKSFPSRNAGEAGMVSALTGSVYICIVCAVTALPIGVGTAILLEEFQPRNKMARLFHSFINLNITNLAGVPSIVYGILGLTLFVFMFNLLDKDKADVGVEEGDIRIEDLSEEEQIAQLTEDYPRVMVGVTWYDTFVDLTGKQTYRVPVESRYSPKTRMADGMDLEQFDGTEIKADVITFDEQDALNEPIWDQTDEYDAELEEKYAALSDKLKYDKLEPMKRKYREKLEAAAFTGKFFEDSQVSRVPIKHFYYFQLPLGRGVLAGGLTLMLVILPIVITASVEAIRAVPDSLREGALACGATKWQMVWNMTLPASVPGVMTGSILAISRAIGEAAPILIIAGGLVFVPFLPKHLMDDFTAMPLQIYNWAGRPQPEFHYVAAAGIIILLAILLSFNAVAVFIRQKYQKPLS